MGDAGPAREVEHVDVVVVGAGLAGLRAAVDLEAGALDVMVIEARDRVGGRVWSHRFPDGQWCERGAEFVDATHTEVLGLAHRLGLTLTPRVAQRRPELMLVDVNGRAVPATSLPSVADGLAAWRGAVADLAERIDPGDPLADTGVAAELDARTAAELLAMIDGSVAARVVVGRELRTEFMVPPGELSQLHLAWMAALAQRAGDGREAFRLHGGNDQLATQLARALRRPVKLGAEVVWIDAASGTVTQADGGRCRARAVVVTLPPPVLSRVGVAPALPGGLLDVGMGVGGKVSVRHRRRVWRDLGADGTVLSDRAFGHLWETTDGQDGDGGVLTALVSSHDGAALLRLPDAEVRVRREMDRIFPGSALLADGSVVTDWTADPWSLGCYAAFSPGQLTGSWAQWRRPHGRVVFAGEHTDAFAGYLEGALRSGARATLQAADLAS